MYLCAGEAWPQQRAGAMVWPRDEHSYFMFGGNRASTTGMCEIMNFVLKTGKCVFKKYKNEELCLKNEELCC